MAERFPKDTHRGPAQESAKLGGQSSPENAPKPQSWQDWIVDQRQKDRLAPLGEESAFKAVYASPDQPDIVVKQFDLNAKEVFENERGAYKILREALGDKFLASTAYVEAGQRADHGYYAVQEKQTGVRYGAAVAETRGRTMSSIVTVSDAKAAWGERWEQGWTAATGHVLLELASGEQLQRVRAEAAELADLLASLEETGKIVEQLDFFVDPTGSIKLTSFRVRDKLDFAYDPNGRQRITDEGAFGSAPKEDELNFPQGSEAIRLIFGLPPASRK